MSCLQWEERVALYAGGDLAPAEAQAVQHHVAECPGCQVLLSGLRANLELVQEAHSEAVDPAHFAAVRARVMAEIEGQSARRWRFAWMYAVGVAALLLSFVWPRPELSLSVPMPSGPTAPVVAKVKLEPPRVVIRAPARTVLAKAQVPQEAAKPMVVKILTNDPDVVIYWITGTKGE